MQPKRKIFRAVLAADIGGTHVRVAVVSSQGGILAQRTAHTPRGRKVRDIVVWLQKTARELSDRMLRSNIRIRGAGVAVPGFLDRSRRRILFSPNFPTWKNIPLARELKGALGIPVILENDANCAALGERWKGAARGSDDVVCLTLGTGVGGGVIVAGRLLYGARGAGGELGHIQVAGDGALCGCGNRGCLETVASGTALRRASGRDAEELFDRARRRNRLALRLFERFGANLGGAIASLCFVFDPEVVVLGGNVSMAWRFFGPAAVREVRRRLRHHPGRKVVVRPGSCGDQAGLLGAAWSVLALDTSDPRQP